MSRKLFLVVTTIVFCGLGTILSPTSVRAESLREAIVRDLVRLVRLTPQNQPPRPARRQDRMKTGDALSTARSSRADLRFNDGSLARLGELALFRFTAGTRNFRLDNGTVLLLIPPGRGRTNINTPNASAGIRGSALFVRYDAATDTTIIGALTDNPNGPMDILNRDESQRQALKAGQMVVIVRDRIQKLYEFDLKTFYETSEIVQGLDLTKQQGANPDGDIAAVQGETSDAFEKQSKTAQDDMVEGRFMPLSAIVTQFYEASNSVANSPTGVKPSPNPIPDTVFKDGVQQPSQKPEPPTSPASPEQPSNPQTPTSPERPTLPIVAEPPRPPQTPVVTEPPANPPTQPPGGNPTPILTPRQPIQSPEPTPIQAPVTPPVQTPSPTPIQTPVIIPTPIQAPVTPPVTPSPIPIQAPVTPPVQTPSPTPIQTPVTPPVTPSPTPIQAPVTPPVQAPAPTIIPTPIQAPVVPPVQQNRPLQSIPTPSAAVQTPATQTPQVTPQPTSTLVPALAPTATPESPATTGQVQQTVK
jgi:FecR protein